MPPLQNRALRETTDLSEMKQLCTTAPENAFTRVRAMNRGLHWTNLGVVATTALLPFPTSVVSTAIEDGNPG
jgi:hypothetical protein